MQLTPYKDVNKLLELLKEELERLLGDQFVGMYLYGSLALDDFVPERSDLDIVIVTKTVLSSALLEKLKSLHKDIALSNHLHAKRMECIYIPIHSLKNYVQEKAYFPCVHVGGTFYTDGFGIIEKHVLREKGITLKGPKPRSFIKPVSPDELKKAAYESLKNWWLPKLKDQSRLLHNDYQVYAVLTMCRALYTLQKGDIVSKSKAVPYAKKILDKKWQPLIDKALSWKIGDDFNKLDETVSLIKFTIDKVGIF